MKLTNINVERHQEGGSVLASSVSKRSTKSVAFLEFLEGLQTARFSLYLYREQTNQVGKTINAHFEGYTSHSVDLVMIFNFHVASEKFFQMNNVPSTIVAFVWKGVPDLCRILNLKLTELDLEFIPFGNCLFRLNPFLHHRTKLTFPFFIRFVEKGLLGFHRRGILSIVEDLQYHTKGQKQKHDQNEFPHPNFLKQQKIVK